LNIKVKKQAMKRFNILSVVAAIVLMVATVSCTTMGGAQNDRRVDRVYVDDPYRGTVVLERDPFTGRYYEVDNYGSSYYGNRYYSRNSRVYSNRYDRGRYYRSNGSTRQQQPTEEQKKQQQQTRSEARKKILGN
jgi:hypothetical protein